MTVEGLRKDLSQQNAHPRDPDVLQHMASNPHESVWVGASAGTGKTKVLTDRVLRLLLPRADGGEGTPPHRILCLTFTKAAASEMALRIAGTLGRWAVMREADLAGTLRALLGVPPSEIQIAAAQRLFAEVVDSPAGLQIMTIHSFCQSVLGRFPLEADLPPNFTVLEDAQSAALMREAQHHVLSAAREEAGSPLQNALNRIAGEMDEDRFLQYVRDMSRERFQLAALFGRYWDAEGLHREICAFYGIDAGQEEEGLIRSLCSETRFDAAGLRAAALALLEGSGKSEPGYGAAILRWLDAPEDVRAAGLDAYREIFLTKEGNPRAQGFPTKGTKERFPACEEILRSEAARLIEAADTARKISSAALTRDLLHLGHGILHEYEALKMRKAALDFDDLIIRTLDLLRGKTRSFAAAGTQSAGDAAPWIMYKLDRGLDHILIDEAQDTNPEQWRIIEALCEEFFAGMSARDDVERTVFTVGDVKQSIYSFQRAAPEEFRRMQARFDRKIREAGKANRDVALDISFRSTASVLRLVDAVFADDSLRAALGGEDIRHESFRAGQAGLVELWPLFEPQKAEKADFWTPPVTVRETAGSAALMAAFTAEKIKGWVQQKEILPAYGRPVQPGDIMILVRTRTAFVDQLVRALKLRGIPVSGVDRMVLGEQLAVQDMLALARFCLLPGDDLNLACVLKSPFAGRDETALFTAAHGRKGSLWAALQDRDSPGYDAELAAWLRGMIRQAQTLGVYEFFSVLLQTPCPADTRSGLRALKKRLGGDALDPVGELMNAALAFGRKGVDSLQLFIEEQDRERIEIKREMEEAGGQVRIMTVHGSKGLQAPIVILPDTVMSGAAKKPPRLLWPDKTGARVPLFSPRGDADPKAYRALAARCEAQQEEEYARLLYVAMTRAADRLYVGGYTGAHAPKENSWYHLVRRAMESLPDAKEAENGEWRFENGQTGAPDRAGTYAAPEETAQGVPDWLFTPAPEEPTPPRPLVPSRPSGEDQDSEQPALSPLAGGVTHRFRRGNVTHKLLQFLPEFEPERQESAALRFMRAQAADLPPETGEEIVREVLAILRHPDYAPFFQKGSMAEAPVTGLGEDGRIVSGRIDRLVIGARDIWILDYKTNRPPPEDPDDIPQIYRKQLAAYGETIAAIYPGRAVHCALLWTDGPRLVLLCGP